MTKTNPVYSANLFKMGSFRRESYSYRIYKLQFIPNKKIIIINLICLQILVS